MNNAMTENRATLLDKPLSAVMRFDWDKTAYIVILILAVLTRFWNLGDRAMSHDESLHTYYSWELYRGNGFNHTPLMHGPLRFHLSALSYALFGVDDFTARIPPAIFGVLLVMSPILLRRWLGKRGALVTSILLLISPMLLYHARYIRDEPFMVLYAVLMLWAILSYYHDRKAKWLYALAALAALMYVTMEAAFIYIAVFGVFVVAAAMFEVAREAGWGRTGVNGTLLALGAALAILVVGLIVGARAMALIEPETLPDGGAPDRLRLIFNLIAILVWGLFIAMGSRFALQRLMPDAARRSTGVHLAVILGALSLLMLSASALSVLDYGAVYERVGDNFKVVADAGTTTVWSVISGTATQVYVDPYFFAGGNFPSDPANIVNVVRLTFLFACFAGLAMGIGLWWDAKKWSIALGIFGGISVTLFTTILTNGTGLGTGFVGSLGYWLAQQAVSRGTQPQGYHFFIGAMYEYLPVLLAIVALIYYGIRYVLGRTNTLKVDGPDLSDRLVVPLLMTYTVLLWAGFTVAGEKMPWHMTHLTLPLILIGGRLLGEWFDRIDWRGVLARHEWLAAPLSPMLAFAFATGIGALTYLIRPAQGTSAPTLTQLSANGQLLSSVLVGGGALAVLVWIARRYGVRSVLQMAGVSALLILALMTIHTSWLFNYVNYDDPVEFGVYAHGGPGLKIALEQIRELSERTTGSPNQIEILYDSKATWPWLWYLRDFPNKRYISGTPSRSDASLPVMILSSENWNAVDQSVGSLYNYFQFHRIWWPMQDYTRISEITACPEQVVRRDNTVVRYTAYDENGDGRIDATEQANGDARCDERSRQLVTAVWQIFFQRDYTLYGDLTGQKLTLQDWPLQEDFRLYVRKDLAAKVWDQTVGSVAGGGTAPSPILSDPYEARFVDVAALHTFGAPGPRDGQFVSPHGMAVAPDGSIYVADSDNHRIQKFDTNGKFLLAFGTWSGQPINNDLLSPNWNPPQGTFTEPWDVAVGPDGSVYVADTWNSRIQKFDASGKFIRMWGHFGDSGGQASGAEGLFYGPRGIAVSKDGTVYVADTGNKRVQAFDADGEFLLQFGGAGLLAGNLDEPVGVATNDANEVIVVDTWNGRLQVFDSTGAALRRWDISGWFDPSAEDSGRSRVGKPYVGTGPDGRVYLADQTRSRILVFSQAGEYQASFGQFGADERSFSAPSGVKIDTDGNVLVVDTGNARVMVFPPVKEKSD